MSRVSTLADLSPAASAASAVIPPPPGRRLRALLLPVLVIALAALLLLLTAGQALRPHTDVEVAAVIVRGMPVVMDDIKADAAAGPSAGVVAAGPVAVALVRASGDEAAAPAYADAVATLVIVLGPYALVSLSAYWASRVGPWQSRVFFSPVAVAGLEYVRPAVAWAAVGAAAWHAGDWRVTAVCALAIAAALAVRRIVEATWYGRLSGRTRARANGL